ncbi:MAG: CDP-alcohol phosphatidyltransferase family protein [Treponemataceae bacterium]|nr:CDP-alcohol phosphatidyltransferase family protein [Treponemataceae bacterium]
MNIKPTITNDFDPKKKYSYSAENLSFIDCYIIIPFAEKLIKKIPLFVPANIITIVSNSFVLLAVVIAATARMTPWPIWILIPFCFLFYLIGDVADGLQARRTKTGSPLGEFCDHFLDTFVTGEMLFCVFCAYGIRNVTLVGILLYISYITQMAAFWEKYVTHKLHLGRFSSTETVVVLSLFATLGHIPVINHFFRQPIGAVIPLFKELMFSVAEFTLCFSSIFAILATIMTFVRVKKISLNFVLYLILSLILTLTASFVEKDSFLIVFLTLSFYHIDYSAALLSAIIMKEKDPTPDFVLTAAMCLTLFFDIHHPALYTLFFLYIVVFVTVRTSLFVHKNAQYWYWINPDISEKEDTKEKKQNR